MENNSHGFDDTLYALVFTSMHAEPTNCRMKSRALAIDRAIELGYQGDDILKVMRRIASHINTTTEES